MNNVCILSAAKMQTLYKAYAGSIFIVVRLKDIMIIYEII